MSVDAAGDARLQAFGECALCVVVVVVMGEQDKDDDMDGVKGK